LSETEPPKTNEGDKLWQELNAEANINFSEAFKNIIRSDEYQYNGDTYHFKMLKPKEMGQLKALQKQELDEDKDWDSYMNNYKERAKLLIKDMTDEKFDNGDFFVLENLVTAWSIRATKGFRKLF
jgi:hypothetical protein